MRRGPRRHFGHTHAHVCEIAHTRTTTHAQPRWPSPPTPPPARTHVHHWAAPAGQQAKGGGYHQSASSSMPIIRAGTIKEAGVEGLPLLPLARHARWSRIPSSLSSFSVFGLQDPLVTAESGQMVDEAGRRTKKAELGRKTGRGGGGGTSLGKDARVCPSLAEQGLGLLQNLLRTTLGPIQNCHEDVTKVKIKNRLRTVPGIISIHDSCCWGVVICSVCCPQPSCACRGACRSASMHAATAGHQGLG